MSVPLLSDSCLVWPQEDNRETIPSKLITMQTSAFASVVSFVRANFSRPSVCAATLHKSSPADVNEAAFPRAYQHEDALLGGIRKEGGNEGERQGGSGPKAKKNASNQGMPSHREGGCSRSVRGEIVQGETKHRQKQRPKKMIVRVGIPRVQHHQGPLPQHTTLLRQDGEARSATPFLTSRSAKMVRVRRLFKNCPTICRMRQGLGPRKRRTGVVPEHTPFRTTPASRDHARNPSQIRM